MALGFTGIGERATPVTISVRPDLAVRLHGALLELRRSQEDSRAPGPERLQAKLVSLDRLIDDLAGESPAEAIDLTGPGELLYEATLVAIDEAGDRISESCTDLLRREEKIDTVREEVKVLDALLDLLSRQP